MCNIWTGPKKKSTTTCTYTYISLSVLYLTKVNKRPHGTVLKRAKPNTPHDYTASKIKSKWLPGSSEILREEISWGGVYGIFQHYMLQGLTDSAWWGNIRPKITTALWGTWIRESAVTRRQAAVGHFDIHRGHTLRDTANDHAARTQWQ